MSFGRRASAITGIVLAMIIDTLRVVINSVVRITDDRSAQFHRKGAG